MQERGGGVNDRDLGALLRRWLEYTGLRERVRELYTDDDGEYVEGRALVDDTDAALLEIEAGQS